MPATSRARQWWRWGLRGKPDPPAVKRVAAIAPRLERVASRHRQLPPFAKALGIDVVRAVDFVDHQAVETRGVENLAHVIDGLIERRGPGAAARQQPDHETPGFLDPRLRAQRHVV